jgi:hypothetical protein
MKLEGRIRTSEEVRVATADAETYDAAKAALEQQVVEGEQLLSIRRFES